MSKHDDNSDSLYTLFSKKHFKLSSVIKNKSVGSIIGKMAGGGPAVPSVFSPDNKDLVTDESSQGNIVIR